MSLHGLHAAKPKLGGGEIQSLYRKYPLLWWGHLSPSDIDIMLPDNPSMKREIDEKIEVKKGGSDAENC